MMTEKFVAEAGQKFRIITAEARLRRCLPYVAREVRIDILLAAEVLAEMAREKGESY